MNHMMSLFFRILGGNTYSKEGQLPRIPPLRKGFTPPLIQSPFKLHPIIIEGSFLFNELLKTVV
jgi:hypothetical protein